MLQKNDLKQTTSLDCPQWQESRRRVYSCNGISPTLCGIGRGGNTEPKILIRRMNGEQNTHNSAP